MDFTRTPDYRGGLEIGLNAWLIGFSTVFCSLRLFVRIFMTKSPGLDDVMTAIGYLLLIVLSAMDIHAVSLGSGAHFDLVPNDLQSKFFESLGIQTLIYFWAVATVRFAILAFLPRLDQDRHTTCASWIVMIIILAQTIAAFIYRLTECTPIADSFKPLTDPGVHCVKLDAHTEMMIGHGVVGIVIDVILLLLPIWVIGTKMIWSKKMIQIILILSVGVFAVATGIIRVALLRKLDFAADITYKMPSLGIWTNLECHVGLWCGCFPALQPILRVMPGKLRLLTRMDSDGNHTRQSHARLGGHSGMKDYQASRENVGETDNESQRAIFLSEMEKRDIASRDRDDASTE
ncbi:hypothetical protein F4677DRAFT_462032 [Hypoxylon crocopeplum]|nr:hypothetical protein F4677DRAFT_462032 [Hypoxylon crocopeplum]